jgi:hypothetical protein
LENLLANLANVLEAEADVHDVVVRRQTELEIRAVLDELNVAAFRVMQPNGGYVLLVNFHHHPSLNDRAETTGSVYARTIGLSMRADSGSVSGGLCRINSRESDPIACASDFLVRHFSNGK